jgi:hypothetical protein
MPSASPRTYSRTLGVVGYDVPTAISDWQFLWLAKVCFDVMTGPIFYSGHAQEDVRKVKI